MAKPDPATASEGFLLQPAVRFRRVRRSLLECPVHSLVPAILFRTPGLDPLATNP
jgi:hypothetical protein